MLLAHLQIHRASHEPTRIGMHEIVEKIQKIHIERNEQRRYHARVPAEKKERERRHKPDAHKGAAQEIVA
jgi:hypothetical protein